MKHETATLSLNGKAGARAVVDALAERLRDPEAVIAATTANGELIDIADIPCPPWDPSTLSRGPGALAILYSELGDRETAHEYLLRTVAASGSSPVDGPFQGLGGLATATRLAARDPEDYAGILARLDDRMSEHARWLVRVHEATREGGVPTCAGIVDTISGLSGVGRYLLARGRFDVLREVLSCLATLREPIVVDGVPVPGWWFDGTEKSLVGPEFSQGQVNFGLAHGIPGPLALLSLAWTAGVRVEGQAEAIECIADWLLEWREKDAWGNYWTAYIPLAYYTDRTAAEPPRPARASWCYGAPAIARTLELAATALDRPEWSEAGLDAFRSLLTRPHESWGITDDALCHGWAGMLYLCTLFDRNHPDENFGAVADEIAAGLVERFDPVLPFGYRYHQPIADLSLDLPGLMEGAAGIALALDGYVRTPRTGWDSALLLS